MLAAEAWDGCCWHLAQHAGPVYHALLMQLKFAGTPASWQNTSLQAQQLHTRCSFHGVKQALASASQELQGPGQQNVRYSTSRSHNIRWTSSEMCVSTSSTHLQRSNTASPKGLDSSAACRLGSAASTLHFSAGRITATTQAATAATQVQAQQTVGDSTLSSSNGYSSSPSGYLAAARAALRQAPDAPGTPKRPLHSPQIAARHHLQQYLASIDRMGFIDDLAAGIRQGNRLSISRALTLCESTRPDHALQAAALLRKLIDNRHQQQEFVNHGSSSSSSSAAQPGSSPFQQVAGAAPQLHPHPQNPQTADLQAALPRATGSSTTLHTSSLRVGLSGPPGAGKSSLIEAWGCYLADHGSKVAVLAVDPSSVETGGAILGDKTRMARLSSHSNAFVRPSPARGTLGGVSRATYDAMVICEAAGYDKVLVETVGVGQSEVAVADLVDCMLLVMPPVGGDDLQMIKRGIMEVADVVLVNKADGATEAAATRAAAEYGGCLRLMPHRYHGWSPQVLAVSAHTGRGVPALARLVAQFQQALTASGELQKSRIRRAESITWLSLEKQLLESLRQDPHTRALMARLMPCVRAGTMAPRSAADIALSYFYQHCS